MSRFIKEPSAIRAFCYEYERLNPIDIIVFTARQLNLHENRRDTIHLVYDIIDYIENTPAYEDDIADAKLRLRLTIEEACMELYPQYRSAMGLKLPPLNKLKPN